LNFVLQVILDKSSNKLELEGQACLMCDLPIFADQDSLVEEIKENGGEGLGDLEVEEGR
jgi:hypothetical protein